MINFIYVHSFSSWIGFRESAVRLWNNWNLVSVKCQCNSFIHSRSIFTWNHFFSSIFFFAVHQRRAINCWNNCRKSIGHWRSNSKKCSIWWANVILSIDKIGDASKVAAYRIVVMSSKQSIQSIRSQIIRLQCSAASFRERSGVAQAILPQRTVTWVSVNGNQL